MIPIKKYPVMSVLYLALAEVLTFFLHKSVDDSNLTGQKEKVSQK